LGRGSYGEVIGATHRRTGARRAVKVVEKACLRRYVKDVGAFVRREVEILRNLDHPHIVRLYESYEDEAFIYIFMEVCSGGDLLERVTVARDRLPEPLSAALMAQMFSAALHLSLQGVVHRDIKPENFLYTHRESEKDPQPVLKLIDFGLSRSLASAVSHRLTPKIGTTEYMAPEAFAGQTKATLAERMDMWSLGVVLHVIFIGHFPSPMLAELTAETYMSQQCWRHISPQGRDFLGRLIRYEPDQRPSPAAAMAHPWLASAVAASADASRWARDLPKAIRLHARSPDLCKIALAAAAREVHEYDLCHVRAIFVELNALCGGSLTRAALVAVVGKPQAHLAALAAELVRNFDTLDVDGSGNVDWSELVAVVVGAGLSRVLRGAMPATADEGACFRAFDLLSQGTGAVSGATLTKLFSLKEGEGEHGNVTGGTGGTGGSTTDSASGGARRIWAACAARSSRQERWPRRGFSR